MNICIRLLVFVYLGLFAQNVQAQNTRAGIEEEDMTVDQVAQLPTTRATKKELRRMTAHIKSLYAKEDIWHRFRNESGQEVDCVDFIAQPGIKHVKGIERPSSGPIVIQTPSGPMELQARDPADKQSFDKQGREQTCPEGSVPILRKRLQDFARFETLESVLSKVPAEHGGATAARAALMPQADEPPNWGAHYHRGWKNLDLPNKGAQAALNIWKPTLGDADGFSLSQIWVFNYESDPEDLWKTQTVEVGWQVSNDRYGDDLPHLFIYYTPDGYDTGCYNLDCGDFIQVSGYYIGGSMSYSTLGGPQHEKTMRWEHCSEALCGIFAGWWLRLGASNWVGWYPISLFDSYGIRDYASSIQFGGEVYDRTQYVTTTTDMGSGVAPLDNCYNGASSLCFGWVAYQRKLHYVNMLHGLINASNLTQHGAANNICYKTYRFYESSWGHYFFFGGPGGDGQITLCGDYPDP